MKGQELTGVRSMCRLLGMQPAPAPPGPDEEDNEVLTKMRFLFALVLKLVLDILYCTVLITSNN